MADAALLPAPFSAWFAARGWSLRVHQSALLEAARAGRSALLIAPTGAGKTLAGFLPSLVELSERFAAAPKRRPHALHTLYVSPLKALTVDVARGTPTKPERLGHREYFIMYKHQDTPPLEIGCRA